MSFPALVSTELLPVHALGVLDMHNELEGLEDASLLLAVARSSSFPRHHFRLFAASDIFYWTATTGILAFDT